MQNWPQDAIATARTFKPDLLLLDLIMPHLPGGNVVEIFEHDAELKEVPIVFFTASVSPSRVEEHEGIICDHPCLAKPARIEKIITFIDANLPPQFWTEVPAPLPLAPPSSALIKSASSHTHSPS